MNSKIFDAPQVLDDRFINWVMQQVLDSDVVSFDIFDTALTRIVDSPADIFAEVEKQAVQNYGNHFKGFALLREEGEKSARIKAQERNHEDVTLNEIYEEIQFATEDQRELIKTLELETERNSVVASQDILQLTHNLNQIGKPWIFVSDMYLPSDFLVKVLTDLGYSGWSRLVVSSEVRYTKSSGNIWPQVLAKHYDLERILHIGDNNWSDYVNPTNYGVRGVPYTRWESNRRVGANLDQHVLPFSYLKRYLDIQGRALNKPYLTDEQEWTSLGQCLGGPLVVSFLKWMNARIKVHEVQRLYFCARDGYLLYKAWKEAKISPEVEARYLHISRRPLQITRGLMESTPTYLSLRLLEYLTATDISTTAVGIFERTCCKDSSLKEELQKEFPDTILKHKHKDGHGGIMKVLRSILSKYSESIYYALEPIKERTISFLRQEGLHDEQIKSALVDTGWTGGQQRAINHALDAQVMGFYFGVWRPSFNNYHKAGLIETAFTNAFDHPHNVSDFQMAVNTLETLCSSDEGTTVDYRLTQDSKYVPLTKTNIKEAEQYETVLKWYQEGTLDVVRTLFSGEDYGPLRLEDCTIEAGRSAVASVICSPTDTELQLIGGLGHCFLTDHTDFNSQIEPKFPSSDDGIDNVLPGKNWMLGTILHWYKMAPLNQKHWMRRVARERLGHLGERRLRQFWY